MTKGINVLRDDGKNRRNLIKHKISFETANLVFDDSFAVSLWERIVEGEKCWQTIGLIGGAVVIIINAIRRSAMINQLHRRKS